MCPIEVSVITVIKPLEFDVQDGERGKRGPPGVQAELVDNLTDETDESDENSTNTCRPYRLRSETCIFPGNLQL